jgi:hypothetical protein
MWQFQYVTHIATVSQLEHVVRFDVLIVTAGNDNLILLGRDYGEIVRACYHSQYHLRNGK